LADRYIYTLIARELVRGLEEEWLENIFGIAIVPDAVFYLDVPPEELLQRTLAKYTALDLLGKRNGPRDFPGTSTPVFLNTKP